MAGHNKCCKALFNAFWMNAIIATQQQQFSIHLKCQNMNFYQMSPKIYFYSSQNEQNQHILHLFQSQIHSIRISNSNNGRNCTQNARNKRRIHICAAHYKRYCVIQPAKLKRSFSTQQLTFKNCFVGLSVANLIGYGKNASKYNPKLDNDPSIISIDML